MRIIPRLVLFLSCLLALHVPTQADTLPLLPESRSSTAWWQEQFQRQTEQLKDGPCGVLFLGDSITDFWSKQGKNIWDTTFKPYHPCNFGVSGDQTSNLLYRIIESGLPATEDPKLCVLMIGTNNTDLKKRAESPEQTAMGILTIAEHLIVRFPKTHVLILGIFPRGDSPEDALRQHNDKINEVVSKCRLPRTSYLNINDQFVDKKGVLLPGITRDKLHLTEKGYGLWAKALLPYLKKYCK
jgi:lysophospholipase L1-like esterase